MSRNSALILATATFFMLIISVITICRLVSLANHPGMNVNSVMFQLNHSNGNLNRSLIHTLKKSDKPEAKELVTQFEARESYRDAHVEARKLAGVKVFCLAANFVLSIFYIVVVAQNEALTGVRKAFWIVAVLIGGIFIMALYAVIFLGPVIIDNTPAGDQPGRIGIDS